MSHYQSRGDRSEAQLKKAGRSSGPGHQRSGAPSTAVKGGGAGGPSPSGSAPPASGVSQINSQSFPAANTSGRPTTPGSGRPTTPGSSTNRGGKRANGPAGVGRNAQSGGSTDHGGSFRNPHHTGAQYQSHQPQQQQPPASVSRQGVGPADSNQHPPTSNAQQSELKQGTPAAQSPNSFSGSRASGTGGASVPRQPSNSVASGAAAKPPAPVLPSASAAVPELASPVATASSGDNVRASMQPHSFSFQFGSISPGFMGPGPGMQIPARTSSAPPNFEEQKREQARFEASRAVVPKKVPTVPSGQQQVQVTGAAGNASEQPHAALQTNQNANIHGPKSGAGTPVVEPPPATKPQGMAQQPVQFSQGQGHVAQHSQAPIHIPATAQAQSQHFQHMQLVQAQAQAHQAQAQAQAQVQQAHAQQAHAQQQHQQQTHQQQTHQQQSHQQQSHQQTPHQQQSQQQQPQQQQQQVLAQQALPQQALVQQSLSQGMKYPQSMMPPHGPQIISQQMGSPLAGQPQMAHQLGPPMGGAMGGQLPPGISGAQYGPPNPYIQPQPSRAIKIVNPATREEVRLDGMDPGPPASVAASSVRVTSNGPPQNRPVTYSSPHHAIPSYYQQLQGGAYGQPPFYQPVPPKSVPAQGPVNPSRNFYGPQTHRYMNVPGAVASPPASKGVPSGGMGGGLAGQAGMEMSAPGAAPLVVSPLGGPPHPIVQTVPPVLSGRPAATSSPVLQPGASHAPASNGRVSSSVPGSVVNSSSVPPTPPASSGVVLKFGDVEASNSAESTSLGESTAENESPSQIPSSGANGTISAADAGVPYQALPVTSSEGPSERREQVSKTTISPASTTRPSISVPSSKVSSASLATTTTTPRVFAVPSGVSPVSGEKPKTENAKPTTISRENSRKMKKEQKQHKQQHQQQPVPTPAVSLDSGGDRKGESLTPTPSTGPGNSQVSSITSDAAVQLASPKPSDPVVQVSGAPIKVSNSLAKSEDSKGILKAVELEKTASGKSSVLSPQTSEVFVFTPTVLSSEAEEGIRRPSKQISTSKSLEGKDVFTTDSSSSKGGVASKLSSSSNATLSVAAVKELVVDRGADSSPKDGPGIKISPTPNLLSDSNLTADDDALEKSSAVDAISDVGSAGRTELEVDDSAVKTSTIPCKSSPVPEVLSMDEGISKVGREPAPPEVEKEASLAEAPALDSVVSKDVDAASDSLPNGRVAIDEQVVVESPVDCGLLIVQNTRSSSIDSTPDETSSVDKEVLEHNNQVFDIGVISDPTKVELATFKDQQSELAASAIERELGAEDISLSKAVAREIETPVVDVPAVGTELGSSIDLEGATDKLVNDVEEKSSAIPLESETVIQDDVQSSVGSIVEPSAAELSSREEPVVTAVDKVSNGEVTDDGVSLSSVPTTTSEMQVPENGGADEQHNLKENLDNFGVAGVNANAETDNLSTFVPEVKQVGSKKKKKKEIFAKADAQGSTGDLFTAYKAPEEKKLDEVKRPETPGSANPGTDAKKDPQSNLEKPVLKELDDWEDAAELPTPKIAPTPSSAASNVSLVPREVSSEGDTGVKKYTKDYLMSQRDLHRDLPLQFEIRADIADILLNPQLSAGFTDSLPSPGRSLDRQSSGGPRLDRRNSNVGAEEDRWTRNAGNVSSPGRGPSDARMDMGMAGPPGGFRPGQANTGIMRMPPGMSPRMGGPGMMPPGMGGLLPGGPLLPMMMPPGPGRNMGGGGVDADRWQRAPAAQKGLIPSPRTPLPAIHKTENRYQVGTISDEEQLKQRLIKGILNKLTPQNFDKLFAQVNEVNIDSATTLTGVISQIFDKALTEPTFCEMYAKFCVQLAVELPEFIEDEEKITFKRVLLNKCQEEFERGEREQEEAEKVEEDGEVKLTPEEREEKRTSARRRMLGNIRFIGELYKKNMLTERIMHECIKKLLGEYQNPDEEDVEALCKLMSTIGRIIDHPKAKEHIDAYFKRMEKLSENMKLSSRLRFMLKDVIDLRRNGWTERRKVEGPKKIDEVHRDAVQERQQAASDRNRPQQRGGMGPGGGRRPGNDFGMRGPPSPMYSAGGQMGGGMGMGGMRGAQTPPGRAGFGQDVRMEDRLLMGDSRMPMPLSQRPSDEGPLTLGPQGTLGRGNPMRQPIVPGRSALADVPPTMLGDVRRPGMGPIPGFGGMMPDRGPYGGREELSTRGHLAERPLGSGDGPLLERPLGPERLGPSISGRGLRGPDRPVERPQLSFAPSSSLRPLTPPTPAVARSAPTAVLPLSEEDFRKKSISTLTEYFSVRDIKEAAQCVDDLKNPKFHPKMVSVWVSEALDKKDVERELLTKLLIYMCKEKEPPLLSQEQISKGFELVLSTLEDTTVDVPRAPEYVGGMFAKLVIAGVLSLAQVGKLVKEGGMEPGSLLEIGDALNLFGVVLDTIRKEKGEAAMIDLYRESKLNLEHFLSPDDKKKVGKFETFLERKNLQCLYPMIPVEKYFREAIARNESGSEILKWVETNVPESISSDAAFFSMVMTEVLRHSVPLDSGGQLVTNQLEKVLEGKIKKFAFLLKGLLPKSVRASQANQRHYIVAVQLFANELGHPPGLISTLFSKLYLEDVISEQVFLKWKDDVKDSTPGRDKAIKETFNWFRWLESAPEEGGDDDE